MMPSPFCEKLPGARAEFRARVLIVDDEPLVRWSLSTGLRLSRFDAVAAADGAEARRLVAGGPPPDVALLDLGLYDVDPRELLDDIRCMAPQCRFLVLMTAGREQSLRRWHGVTVLEKPFDLADVVRRIDAVLRRSESPDRHDVERQVKVRTA